jgi:hypothetical protein
MFQAAQDLRRSRPRRIEQTDGQMRHLTAISRHALGGGRAVQTLRDTLRLGRPAAG